MFSLVCCKYSKHMYMFYMFLVYAFLCNSFSCSQIFRYYLMYILIICVEFLLLDGFTLVSTQNSILNKFHSTLVSYLFTYLSNFGLLKLFCIFMNLEISMTLRRIHIRHSFSTMLETPITKFFILAIGWLPWSGHTQ